MEIIETSKLDLYVPLFSKFQILYTRQQVEKLISYFPKSESARVPRKNETLIINSSDGIISVTKSVEKSTDNKNLWLVKAY